MLKNRVMQFNNFNEYRKFVDTIKSRQWVIDIRDLKPWTVNENGTLVLDFGIGEIPVRETALNSILCRYGLSGAAFRDEKTSDENLAKVLNEFKHMLPEFVKIMVCDDAINSVNTQMYSHIPLGEILDESLLTVGNFFKKDVNCEVLSSYDLTYIKFKTDKRFKFNGMSQKLVITLSNSENGMGSVRYGAYLGNGLPVMNDISIVHKKNSNLETVQNAVESLDVVVNQAIKALRLLEKINVTAPVGAVNRLGKNAGLPKCYLEEVTEKIKEEPTKEYTAANLYQMLVQAVLDGKDSPRIQERYKNDLLKLIHADWSLFSKTE